MVPVVYSPWSDFPFRWVWPPVLGIIGGVFGCVLIDKGMLEFVV